MMTIVRKAVRNPAFLTKGKKREASQSIGLQGFLSGPSIMKGSELQAWKNQITTQQSGCDLKRSCDKMSEK